MSLIEEALRRLQDPPIAPDGSLPRPSRPQSQAPAAAEPAGTAASRPWPTDLGTGLSSTGHPMALLLVTLVSVVLIFGVALFLGGAWWVSRTLSQIPSPPSSRLIASTTLNSFPPQEAIAVQPAAPAPAADADAPPAAPAAEDIVLETQTEAPEKAAAVSPPEASYTISGIVEGVGESYAVINGAISAVGDRLADYTIVEIKKGSARLRRDDGSEITLRVPR